MPSKAKQKLPETKAVQQRAREGADSTDRFVILGRISGLHGVQGWVKIHSDTQPRENILTYDPLYLMQNGEWVERRLERGRLQGNTVVAKLNGCNDRETARTLMGADIAVRRSQLPDSMEVGEYYWTDLKGLTVINREGINLGQVDYLFETGSNDVMVLKGERERLVPYIWQQVVLDVDLLKGQMIVDWDTDF